MDPLPNALQLAERLLNLEKKNRRLTFSLWALTGLLLALGALVVKPLLADDGKAKGDPQELRTQRLTIVNEAGDAIGSFGRDENGGVLQVAGGESMVTILAGRAGAVVAQHGNHLSYMSADRDVCLFKISGPRMEAAVKSAASTGECAFWVSSDAKGRAYLGINNEYGASGFLRSDEGRAAWDAAEKSPPPR